MRAAPMLKRWVSSRSCGQITIRLSRVSPISGKISFNSPTMRLEYGLDVARRRPNGTRTPRRRPAGAAVSTARSGLASAMASDNAGAQQVMNVEDADRPPAFDHEKAGEGPIG